MLPSVAKKASRISYHATNTNIDQKGLTKLIALNDLSIIKTTYMLIPST